MSAAIEPEVTDEERQAWAKRITEQGLSWSQLSRMFNSYFLEHATTKEYAGVPMPIEGLKLTIEDNYPYKGLEAASNKDEVDPDDAKYRTRNQWVSRRARCWVAIVDNLETGKIEHVTMPHSPEQRRLIYHLGTFLASWAWSIDAEMKAQQALMGLLSENQFRYYLFTGTFLETSKRSGVTYMFRRGRPTLALGRGSLWLMEKAAEMGAGADAIEMRRVVIAALCLHPIAYYKETFAGAMTPSDEVVAHLMLMRGDEALYWRRSNQHRYWQAEAGL